MSKTTGGVLIAVMVLFGLSNQFLVRKAAAKPQIVYGQPACTTYVPPSWGEYKGSSEHYGIVFQDSSGTLRFVTNVPCQTVPQIALQVVRTSPPN